MGEHRLPPGPWAAKGNRVYAADGEEIAVATRASSRWRGSADWTAQALAALPALEKACRVVLLDRRIRAWLRENDPKAMEQMLNAVIDVDPDICTKVTDADRLTAGKNRRDGEEGEDVGS